MPESSIESMTELLGSNYDILTQNGEPVVVEKSFGLAPNQNDNAPETEEKQTQKRDKTFDDYVFQFYIGSLTVVGLFILFRMIQKSR
jgi:hypothetical protein